MFFFLLAFNTTGQENLILNGDFEEYWTCPDNLSQIERCKNVYNPITNNPPFFVSTPDYFNSCDLSSNNVSIPTNALGFQEAESGSGYLGFFMYKTLNSYYHEYIQLELSTSLIESMTYKFSIYVNVSNNYEYITNNIQFKFVEDNISYNVFLNEIMNADYKNTTIIDDSLAWTKLEFEYLAEGGEKFLIIGNFDNPINTSYIFLYDLIGINNGESTYLYFDNASLVEIDIPIQYPNVFTPNGDSVNDYFSILQGEEQVDELYILNRWGNVVYESESNFNWDGKDKNGNELTEGVYFVKVLPKYYQEEKKEQYHGIVHLIR